MIVAPFRSHRNLLDSIARIHLAISKTRTRGTQHFMTSHKRNVYTMTYYQHFYLTLDLASQWYATSGSSVRQLKKISGEINQALVARAGN